MNIMEILHFTIGVILPLFLAVWIHRVAINIPDEHPMDTTEQYWRNARNLCINIAVFSAIGFFLGITAKVLCTVVLDVQITDIYISSVWILVSIIIWYFWPMKLLYVPHTNAIMRTTNRFYTGKRPLHDNQGMVDNAVKYHGPIWSIINIFDQFQGYVETESRENLNISISQLTFLDDVGSASFITSFAVEDADAYAANGDTEKDRIKKVSETVSARIKTLIERTTQGKEIREVMSKPEIFFGSISDEFKDSSRNIELRLGIRIQYIEVTDVNESEEHRKGLAASGVASVLFAQSKSVFEQAKSCGMPITMNEAMQFVSGWSGKAEMNINMWSLDTKGLEELRNFQLGMNPGTGGKGGNKPKKP
jgi:hypothetical protein